MVKVNKRFVWSDAWILLAVIYADGQGCDLDNLIKIADYINHAIPTKVELNGAIVRLTQAKMIKESKGKFKAAAKVMKAYSRTHTPRRTALKEVEDMEKFLSVQRT